MSYTRAERAQIRRIKTLAGKKRDQLQAATVETLGSLGDGDMYRREAYAGARTAAGKTVTVDSGLGLPVVYAAIRIRSDTVSSLPLPTFLRSKGGGRQEAFWLPSYGVLHDRANPEMVAQELWGTVETHGCGWGEAFLGKTFQGDVVTELWPIRPDLVSIERTRGQKLFWVRTPTGALYPNPFTAREIIHIKWFTLDGLRGISPIGLAREAVAAGLAIQEAANRYWSNGGLPVGVLQTDKTLDEGRAQLLAADWRAKYGGSRNAGKIAVLEDGLTFQPIAIPAQDAQFVEQWKMSVTQVGQIMRVPLSLLGANVGEHSLTYRTVEGDNLHYLQHSIGPSLVRIEKTIGADPDLFPIAKGSTTSAAYPEFDVSALLRTDGLTQAKITQIEIGNRPFKHPSEARTERNLPADASFDLLPPGKPPGDAGASDTPAGGGPQDVGATPA